MAANETTTYIDDIRVFDSSPITGLELAADNINNGYPLVVHVSKALINAGRVFLTEKSRYINHCKLDAAVDSYADIVATPYGEWSSDQIAVFPEVVLWNRETKREGSRRKNRYNTQVKDSF